MTIFSVIFQVAIVSITKVYQYNKSHLVSINMYLDALLFVHNPKLYSSAQAQLYHTELLASSE